MTSANVDSVIRRHNLVWSENSGDGKNRRPPDVNGRAFYDAASRHSLRFTQAPTGLPWKGEVRWSPGAMWATMGVA